MADYTDPNNTNNRTETIDYSYDSRSHLLQAVQRTDCVNLDDRIITDTHTRNHNGYLLKWVREVNWCDDKEVDWAVMENHAPDSKGDPLWVVTERDDSHGIGTPDVEYTGMITYRRNEDGWILEYFNLSYLDSDDTLDRVIAKYERNDKRVCNKANS